MMPDLIAGRYRLGKRLGAGGEAQVYSAHDEETDTDVALRQPVAPSGLDAARPALPTIEPYPVGWVRCLQVGFDPKIGAFQTLELLSGPTLRDELTSGSFSLSAAQDFIEQSLEAVSELHEKIGPHGDLQDANFLHHHGAKNTSWKLLELPFLSFRTGTQKNPYFGDARTLAPERWNGAAPSISSDLYALGNLFYKMVAGVYPHCGSNSAEIAIHHLRFSATPLSEITPAAPDLLCQGIMRLLHLDPTQRFSSARSALTYFKDGRAG